MTRRLPWERDDDAPSKTPVKKTATSSTPSRQTATPQRATPKPRATPTETPRESSNRHPARSNCFLGGRSPSTSPPPQPLSETFMIDGLEGDDKYRMVEDELFTIAGQFTAHLHAAEYQRLKAQTRSQNAETIKNISRPVVGSLTELARKRQEELLRKKKQREALRQARIEAGNDDKSGDETNVPWRGTSLQGLMESPRKKEVPLMALTKMDSGTKASTLFGGVMKSQNKRPAPALRKEQIEEETEDESDGDLGGPVRVPLKKAHVPVPSSKPIPREPSRPVAQPRRAGNSMALPSEPKSTSNPRTQPTPTTAKVASSSSGTPNTATSLADSNDDDDDDLFTRFKNRKATARQRRGAPKKEDPEQPTSGDIIPSFM